jgi:hypothetical protein
MNQPTAPGRQRVDTVFARLVTIAMLIVALVSLPTRLALASGTPSINGVNPGSGPTAGNTSATISGANLSGVSSVTFGGIAAVIDSNDATSIGVTVPAHAAGQVDVVVTTAGGSATLTNGYVYIDAPTISAPANGSYVTNASVAFSGTASPGSTVTVKEGLNTLCTTTAGVGGAWSCTATLGQGGHIVSVTSTIGSATTGSATRSFIVDSEAPDPPDVDSPLDGSATSDGTPAFGGTAEPLSTVTVRVDGTIVCTDIADGSTGAWGCDSSQLSEASHSASMTATDAATNVSSATNLSFVVDVTRPAAPVVTSPTNESVTKNTTPTFSGTAEAGSTVKVMDGTTTLCTIQAGGGEAWSCISGSTLGEGIHNISATATDAAGNDSTDATLAIEIDLTAPAQPTIGTATITGDTTPTFFGTAEKGSLIAVTVDGAASCTTTATGAGSWSCVAGSTLSQAAHSVSVTATDVTSNISPPAILALTVDTTQPDSPAFGSTATTNDTTPVFAGTAEPNGTVRVSVDGTLYCTVTANGAGNWNNCTSGTALSAGSHTVTATAMDAANNTSPPATQSLTIDTSAPAAPAISSPAATNDTTPTFAGMAEPGSTVTVGDGATTLCTDTASASGAWSCGAAAPLVPGNHNISVTATDAANNTSSAATQTLTVDASAPAAPVVTGPTAGASVKDMPTFGGTAEAGATITVKDGETVICTATVDGASNWSCSAAAPLSERVHAISIVVTDSAGNTSVATEVPIGVDVTAPPRPLVTIGAATSDQTPLISGQAEPGSTVTLLIDLDNNPATNDSVTYVTTANASGTWSVDTGSATPTSGTFAAGGLAEGTMVGLQVTARDAAGNISSVLTQPLFIGFETYLPIMNLSR